MQKFNIKSAMSALVTALFFLFVQTTFAQSVKTFDESQKSSEEAIRELKQRGEYDSLMDAVKNAREKDSANGEKDSANDDNQPQNAVGQSAKLTANDGSANDNFGWSVAVSGNYAIVGARFDTINGNTFQGSAYIFIKTGTVWTQQAQLIASDGAGNDFFGGSVSISGSTAVVGAFQDTVNGAAAQGSAYVFVRSGTTWTQQAKLTASDGFPNDFFGYSVAVSGNTVIVGAYLDDIGANTNQGSAYIFTRSGTLWTEQTKFTAPDGAANDQFGISVSVSSGTAIVGAHRHDVGVNSDQGSAYVFVQSGTIWTQQAQLLASDGADGDFFGVSVGISDNTAIIGARSDDVGGNTNQGSAYIFTRSGTTWSQQAQLFASDGAATDQFGGGVGISGNTAVVGAFQDDVGTNNDQGSAYVFTRSGTTWTQLPRLSANDGATDDIFGRSVAIDGNNLIVGAYQDNIGANNLQGSAYAFRVLGPTWTQEAFKVAADGATEDLFGNSVAISSDTAIVGAPRDDVGANVNQGSAYIFVRNGTAWTLQTQLIADDGATLDLFGFSVAIDGDTAVVGAYADDVGANSNQGSAYVFVRNGTAWTQQTKLLAADGAAEDLFGNSVAISGSIIIAGAPLDDVGANSNQGSAYIFVRSGTAWTQQTKLLAADGAAEDLFGNSAAIDGDTAIVGAYADDVGANSNQGSAYVFIRNGTAWTQQTKLLAADGAVEDVFGYSVAIDGDTAVVGAYRDDVGANSNQGSAYVFVRNGTAWTLQTKLLAADGAGIDFFGYSVSIDGDTAVVGAYADDVGSGFNQGSAYVFERAGTVWTEKQRLTAAAGASGDNFGNSVAISGDKIIAGIPYSDAAASSPLALAPQATDQGAVAFFVNDTLATTAAGAIVSGRVLTADGRGLNGATVSLTDQQGVTRTVTTSSFGFYGFEDVQAGASYLVTVRSKRFQFAPQIVNVNDNIANLDFIPNQ